MIAHHKPSNTRFQSTYLYKVRHHPACLPTPYTSFNPRTYIRYDRFDTLAEFRSFMFQSTYLYKVRHRHKVSLLLIMSFNPRTYIRYDPRPEGFKAPPSCFNPRTYIRYDTRPSFRHLRLKFQSTYLYKVRRSVISLGKIMESFNPRTYIRYDRISRNIVCTCKSFNPRTYIRYDGYDMCAICIVSIVSIHVPI